MTKTFFGGDKISVGDVRKFRNTHYPSLDGKTGQVMDIWQDGEWISFKFDCDGPRMAVSRPEIAYSKIN